MSEEQRRILQMVQDGIITAQEAETLLKAIEDEVTIESTPEDEEITIVEYTPGGGEIETSISASGKSKTPNMDQFRRHWEIPFAIGIILVGTGGICISSGGPGLLVFCGWTIFLVALLITLLGLWSRTSPWVHIRIREHDGNRFSLSLPLPPYGFLEGILHFSKRFVDKETDQNLDLAISFLSTIKDNPPDEPISIDIDDEDGDKVQVFVG